MSLLKLLIRTKKLLIQSLSNYESFFFKETKLAHPN